MGLVLALSLLGSAVVGLRGRSPEEARPSPARRKASSESLSEPEVTTAVLPAEPERAGSPPVAPQPDPPEGRRTAWDQGFRESRSAGWEGSLTGQVLSPQGPVSGVRVMIEWVAAFKPPADESLRLKRGRSRPDRDGTWWSKAETVTDERGYFSIDGVPGVQVRVKAGGRTVTAQPGAVVVLRLDEF